MLNSYDLLYWLLNDVVEHYAKSAVGYYLANILLAHLLITT